MQLISQCLQAGLLIWFALLAALVVGRVLQNDISATGVLMQSRTDNSVAPERAVIMAVSPAIIIGYMVLGLHTDVSGPKPSLPDIPDQLINLLIGTNGLYLAGKIARG